MKHQPLPPDVLADALQDRITPSSGRLRYSTPVTRKERRMLNERERLQTLYEHLLEITDETAHPTDETAHPTVDMKHALNVCRMLSSGRGALIHDLDEQITTLTAALLSGKQQVATVTQQLADVKAGLEHAGYAPDWALVELTGNLRQRLERETLERVKAQRSIVLICEMAAQLTDPTALERIHDILHPEEQP